MYTLEGKPRRNRRYSSYKNSSLPTMADKLLFILNYLKTNPLQEAHGQLFGMRQSQVHQCIHLLLPRVNQSLADFGELPARHPQDLDLEEDDVGLFIHDGTEGAITRPLDSQEQRLYYSGQQKRHTIKKALRHNLGWV